MEKWKRNLFIVVLAQFVIRAAHTFVLPYLALFVAELGVSDPKQVAFWAGAIASANFLGQSLCSPIWGSLADRYGRKAMLLRSILAIGIFTLMMSIVVSPLQLFLVRLTLGCFSGFNAAAIAYISTETPKEKLGYSLGWLQTGQMAGFLIGPAIGGVLAHIWGFKGSFIIAGLITLGLFGLVYFVTETRTGHPSGNPTQEKRKGILEALKIIGKQPVQMALFFIIIITQLSNKSIEPQLAIFLSTIYEGKNLELVIANVFMITAVSNVILAPILGRFGDKNNHFQVLFWCLLGAGLVTIGQIWVNNIWQLLILRFALGAFLAGILPSANALIGTHTPFAQRGAVFGFLASANALGNFAGPIFGGSIIGLFGVDYGFYLVFCLTGMMFLLGGAFIRRWGRYGREEEA
ncbi:MFS transporter [Candidatus Formimonas warabiya]|uniref:Major facilitator superfamily (MFS) profile domain-containing protein n=1 Tax=Formimonas warabiya TaxID=1761012 RepID=A0A3G1KY55_FORW1|nr:MFS transporter [Candidatus Formimonas warabiya]ATW27145.1 hypothetical protein DCMF_22490 [Candidatus Formimonas warabiya]